MRRRTFVQERIPRMAAVSESQRRRILKINSQPDWARRGMSGQAGAGTARAGKDGGAAEIPARGRRAIYSARCSCRRSALGREFFNALAGIGLERGRRDGASAGDADGDCDIEARRFRRRCGSGRECRAADLLSR